MIDGPWRLQARPGAAGARPAPGTRELGSGALLHVPETEGPWPLVVLFHGAGSSARAGLSLVTAGAVLLAPQSAGSTWDMIERGFGPDVTRLDGALASVFATCPIDPERVVFGGFSDGASYALSLGLANGDLVTHIVAFSPGFVAAPETLGRPRIFVTHGTDDPVLPVDRCGRTVVRRLRGAGYEVSYEEFDGGHAVAHAGRAVDWFSAGRGA
jgi:predicted esterase